MSNKARRYAGNGSNFSSPAGWSRVNPYLRRKIMVTWIAMAIVILGCYIMITNYGYWFGNKTRDGIPIDQEAAAVSVPGEAVAPDAGGVPLYVPAVTEVTVTTADHTVYEDQLGLGNPAENIYYLAYRLELAGQELYQSKLYAPGAGPAPAGKIFQFGPGAHPLKIYYRFYQPRGMLVFIEEVERDLTVVAE